MFGVNPRYVEDARALVERDPPAAATVKAGTVTLKAAYANLLQREGYDRGRTAILRQLRIEHPDLANAVFSGEIGLEEAETSAKQRDVELKQQRWATTTAILDGIKSLKRPAASAAEVAYLFDPTMAETRGDKLSAADLRDVSEFCLALAEIV